jgi:hypothetical protein
VEGETYQRLVAKDMNVWRMLKQFKDDFLHDLDGDVSA